MVSRPLGPSLEEHVCHAPFPSVCSHRPWGTVLMGDLESPQVSGPAAEALSEVTSGHLR